MALHPDKIVSINSAVGGHYQPPEAQTVEQAAVNAANTRKQKALPDEPGKIESTAFQLRDAHWNNHLSRLKGMVKPNQQSKPQPTQGTGITLLLPGVNPNG